MTSTPTEERQVEVLKQNSDDLSCILTALHPLFDRPFDVIGDDDQALITLKYEDWTHLLFILKPFFPQQIARIEAALFPSTVTHEPL